MKTRIIFLPIPESFQEWDEFAINPDIPIPVEIPEDCEADSLESLSIESIIYGMLRVIEERQVEQ